MRSGDVVPRTALPAEIPGAVDESRRYRTQAELRARFVRPRPPSAGGVSGSLCLQELPYPGGHRLRVVQRSQEDRVAGPIALEEALIEHLAGGKGATARIPRQAKEPHALGG